MDDGTSIAPDGDLWAFIGDELKMGIPENDRIREQGNDSNLLIVFYVQIMPDDFVMQLHRF